MRLRGFYLIFSPLTDYKLTHETTGKSLNHLNTIPPPPALIYSEVKRMLLRGFCPQGSILGSRGLIPELHPACSLELRIHLWRCLLELSTWISFRHYSTTSLNLNPSSSCSSILGAGTSVSPSTWAADPGVSPPPSSQPSPIQIPKPCLPDPAHRPFLTLT